MSIKKLGITIMVLFGIVTFTIFVVDIKREFGPGTIPYLADIKAIVYDDKTYYYVPIPNNRICTYTSSKFLGKTVDGQRVCNVDNTTRFICTRTWDGSPALYAENPEEVFTSRAATGVYVNKKYIDSSEAAYFFLSLSSISGEARTYNKPSPRSFSISICYGGLPIGTVWLGKIIVDDIWIYVTSVEVGRWLDINLSNRDYNKINGVIISDEDTIQRLKSYIGLT